MIVGVDNVQVTTLFTSTQAPILNALTMRNPGYGATATFGGNTSDPTITGTVSDVGSVNNIASIEVDPENNGFGNADDYQITNIDALGNFSTTLPSLFPDGTQLLPGPITVAFRVIDRAGNVSAIQRITFNYQGPSTQAFQALGPGPHHTRARASTSPRSRARSWLPWSILRIRRATLSMRLPAMEASGRPLTAGQIGSRSPITSPTRPWAMWRCRPAISRFLQASRIPFT